MTEKSNDSASEEMVTGNACKQDPVSFTDRASYDPEQTKEIDDNPPDDEADPSLDDLITNAQWVIFQNQQEQWYHPFLQINYPGAYRHEKIHL